VPLLCAQRDTADRSWKGSGVCLWGGGEKVGNGKHTGVGVGPAHQAPRVIYGYAPGRELRKI